MNINLVLDIAQLAISLADGQVNGPAQADLTVTATLLLILRKGAQAYSQHTGEPLDPSLIKEEAPI